MTEPGTFLLTFKTGTSPNTAHGDNTHNSDGVSIPNKKGSRQARTMCLMAQELSHEVLELSAYPVNMLQEIPTTIGGRGGGSNLMGFSIPVSCLEEFMAFQVCLPKEALFRQQMYHKCRYILTDDESVAFMNWNNLADRIRFSQFVGKNS